MLGFGKQSRAEAESDLPVLTTHEPRTSAACERQSAADDAQKALRRQRERHWTVLVMSTLIVTIACSLSVVGTDRVAIAALPGILLPPTCVSWNLFGIRCPGCGLTRSFVYLAHGDWSAAWQMHRLGWLLFAVLLAQFPYRILALCRPGRPPLGALLPKLVGYLLIGCLLVNWLAEVLLKSAS
jgi:hypothetical protein